VRKRFAISGLLIASIIVLLILWFSWTHLNEPVVFTYQLYQIPYEAYTQQKHTLRVPVELSDGMDRNEAVQVAYALFNETMGPVQHELVSANMTQEGNWIVQISWDYGHWFNATIDPSNRTITYDHCK